MELHPRPITTIRCRGRRRAASYHPTPRPDPRPLPEWLKVSEAADLLQVGQTSVRDAIRQGVIPAFRIGRHLRIPRAALTARLLQLSATSEASEHWRRYLAHHEDALNW